MESDDENHHIGEKRKSQPLNEGASCSKKSKNDELQNMLSQLLTKKEKLSEEFLNVLMSSLENENEFEYSADLTFQERIASAERKLMGFSSVLANKLKPIFRDLVNEHNQNEMASKFAVINAQNDNEEDLSEKYKTCFLHFINSDDVNFEAANKNLIKTMDMKDYFTVVFYSQLTCRRSAGDNLLQIIIGGKSSTGKTFIFENPLGEVIHNVSSDSGVGKYKVGSKTTIGFHDISLKSLLVGSQVDKIKSFCRTETIQVKIHSKTNSVKPSFVFISSNQRMNHHRFKTAKKDGFLKRTLYKSDLKASKTIHEEDIAAVRNRFIELTVREKPFIPENAIPSSTTFKRDDAIKGLHHIVIQILEKYQKSDLSTDYLYLYPIIGLSRNLHLLGRDEAEQIHHQILLDFIPKFKLTEKQIKQVLESLEAEPRVIKTEEN